MKHCSTSASQIGGSFVFQTAMDTKRGKIIGVTGAHNHRHSPTCRHTGDIDPVVINSVLRFDAIHHASKNGRFASAALLAASFIPCPAPGNVILSSLLRIEHQKVVGVSQHIEARSLGKIIRVLRTTMQSHEQRNRRTVRITTRNIQFVRS